MAKTKSGTVVSWRNSSPSLAVFRLMPEGNARFPKYKAGQYIALGRTDCRLTRKAPGGHNPPRFVADLSEQGEEKRGMITHAYSIASAPFETEAEGHLEFYVILERDTEGNLGRLTESMFRMDPAGDNQLTYFDTIKGEFTLERRAAGFDSVVFVGTGTGVAPFVSMIKQLHFEAGRGASDRTRYTLLHANRTYEELDYRADFAAIAAAQRLDFVYVPSVSRPTPRDLENAALGKGRANNLLRLVFGMPAKEEQDLSEAAARRLDAAQAKKALERTVMPELPRDASLADLQRRVRSPKTVIVTCGNPDSMADIQYVADAQHVHFEKEDW
jgi:ferredoxin-NADP reductase